MTIRVTRKALTAQRCRVVWSQDAALAALDSAKLSTDDRTYRHNMYVGACARAAQEYQLLRKMRVVR